MEKVIADIRGNKLGRALVRLWVMAGIYANRNLTLNLWEHKAGKVQRESRSKALRQDLKNGNAISLDQANQDPLALVRALDSFLADEMRVDRPLSRVPHVIDSAEYWLVRHPLARRRNASQVDQPNNRAAWFRAHSVIPAQVGEAHAPLLVTVLEPDLATANALDAILAAASIRIFVAHFDDGVCLQGVSNQAEKRFFTGFDEPATRSQSIHATLERAHRENADVVVFPELTVTPEQRDEIAIWQRGAKKTGSSPTLIVSGSFHEQIEGRKVNRAELLGLSMPLLVHEKIRPFGHAEGFAEDFENGNRLELLATSIGLIAMPICKDFNDIVDGLPWPRIAPDWCLVPSMGDEGNVNAHAKRAKELWDVFARTVSAVANQELDQAKTKAPGFCHDAARTNIAPGGACIEIQLNP